MDEATVAQILELRRAGAGFELIAERFGVEAPVVRAVCADALADSGHLAFDPALEADRLDRMLMAVWQKAARGDLGAVDRALRISERRERLQLGTTATAHGGIAVVAATGDRLATLGALRDLLAREIQGCESSRDLAALSRQLTLVLADIEELAPPAAEKGTPLDELRKRRAARGPTPKGSGRSTKPAV